MKTIRFAEMTNAQLTTFLVSLRNESDRRFVRDVESMSAAQRKAESLRNIQYAAALTEFRSRGLSLDILWEG